jgi:hypothetical protein
MNAITYYLPNGEIDSVLTGDASVIEATIEVAELPWIEGAWDRLTHYVLDNQAVERPVNPATLNNLTLQNLPVPCKIIINSTEYDCSESEIELELPMINEYLITVMAFPYLDAEFEIET